MKISLVHPSRSRLVRAEEAFREWTAGASGTHAIEHVLSVDSDDPDLNGYRELAARGGSRLVVGENHRMVEAMNRGAKEATGDVLIGLSDDFGCPEHWDALLAGILDGRSEAAVLVHDDTDGRVMTLPIVTRAFFQRLGYLYHPSYISLFADDDLTEVARRAGVLADARHLRFPHRHYLNERAAADATYLRQNSNRAWWHGWRTFEKRRLANFEPPGTGARVAGLRVDAYYFFRVGGARLRRIWLGALPAPLRGVERRARNTLLRLAARATSTEPRE